MRVFNSDISLCLQKRAIDEEIFEINTVIKYVAKYELESKFPLRHLQKQIVKLEKDKAQIDCRNTWLGMFRTFSFSFFVY